MASKPTMASMGGCNATKWSRRHDAAGSSHEMFSGRPADDWFGTNRPSSESSAGRAHLSAAEKRGREGPEKLAIFHERTVACARRIRLSRRSPAQPLPAGLLPILGTGDLNLVG